MKTTSFPCCAREGRSCPRAARQSSCCLDTNPLPAQEHVPLLERVRDTSCTIRLSARLPMQELIIARSTSSCVGKYLCCTENDLSLGQQEILLLVGRRTFPLVVAYDFSNGLYRYPYSYYGNQACGKYIPIPIPLHQVPCVDILS